VLPLLLLTGGVGGAVVARGGGGGVGEGAWTVETARGRRGGGGGARNGSGTTDRTTAGHCGEDTTKGTVGLAALEERRGEAGVALARVLGALLAPDEPLAAAGDVPSVPRVHELTVTPERRFGRVHLGALGARVEELLGSGGQHRNEGLSVMTGAVGTYKRGAAQRRHTEQT
jgi:hypothetical protein